MGVIERTRWANQVTEDLEPEIRGLWYDLKRSMTEAETNMVSPQPAYKSLSMLLTNSQSYRRIRGEEDSGLNKKRKGGGSVATTVLPTLPHPIYQEMAHARRASNNLLFPFPFLSSGDGVVLVLCCYSSDL